MVQKWKKKEDDLRRVKKTQTEFLREGSEMVTETNEKKIS